MFIHYCFKNKNYIKSKRDFLSDYSLLKSQEIDMTLSGKYLSKYDKFDLEIDKMDKYPYHEDINELETLLKKKFNIKKEIIIGSGVNGLIQNIIKILFIKKGNLVTPYYTFNQVEFGVSSFNGYTKRVYCNDYKIDLEKISKSIDRKTRMVYICNPNNPTGVYLDAFELLNFVKKVKIPVVIDESGIEFSGEKSMLDLKNFPDNLIVLRSFSKAYGIANLRIGYLVCSKEFKRKYLMKTTINEFSGISCDIAKKVINSSNVKKNINFIVEERKKMEKCLSNIGVSLIESKSNIIMTKTSFKDDFIKILSKNKISVVPVSDENGNLHIRIAIQDKETNKLFIKEFSKIAPKYML